jgi:predicted nucleotidyltransferase
MSTNPQPPVASKADLLQRLTAIAPAIRGLGVHRLGLFGSFRHDRPTPDSDVDLYVELVPGEATFDHFMDLSFLCEERCGRRVEIVTPSSLSPYLGPRILPCPKCPVDSGGECSLGPTAGPPDQSETNTLWN